MVYYLELEGNKCLAAVFARNLENIKRIHLILPPICFTSLFHEIEKENNFLLVQNSFFFSVCKLKQELWYFIPFFVFGFGSLLEKQKENHAYKVTKIQKTKDENTGWTKQCKLVVNIKKWVDIIEYKYVHMKLVHACWENWQYALTMQVTFGDIAL